MQSLDNGFVKGIEMPNLIRYYKNIQTGDDYLSDSHNGNLDFLNDLLNRGIHFDKNMDSFSATFTCAAGAEVSIENKLKQIPNEWIIIDARNGGPLIRGTTAWTRDFLYLANIGDTGEFKVRFFHVDFR